MIQKNNSFFETLNKIQSENWVRSINSSKIINWIDDLFLILFPEKTLNSETIENLWNINKSNLIAFLLDIEKDKSKIQITEIADQLYNLIPELYYNLQKDAKALLDTDPAANCIQEIINSYPGFTAIAIYRIANAISKLHVVMVPRILTEYAHSKTGIDIHPKATIGVPFVIDHGTGIVIGETTIIGKNVCIYQGVTLGAMQVEKSMEEKKRHPTVEDNVVIYANATILGGSTIIGNHSIIGGNTFVTKSVNPYSFVMQASKNTVLNQIEINNINSFNI
ncbi:serine acetyltransferase [Flavobacterium sp.]|uniref:serine O-acetyltransferase n=1 Tax=Flavobacterium sp. TaxID=239 RepID=UPI00286A651A|nr:serine acetyltransferase [Flavobacterium sp.]